MADGGGGGGGGAAAASTTPAPAPATTRRPMHSTPKDQMLQPRVACGAPIRAHVLDPLPGPEGAAAAASAEGGGAVVGISATVTTAATSPASAAVLPQPSCDCGRLHLVRGVTYQYCTCGLAPAGTQPMCDGTSCLGTRFTPLPFSIGMDKRQANVLLCPCKRTGAAPLCDGSHIKITWADLEW